jgi:FtsZ-binding cell division protein ZapB
MRYDPENPNHRNLLRDHAALEGDDCPVDDICDSIPAILNYIALLNEQVRTLKSKNQNLTAALNDALRKINNVKSQKQRRLKKKGK